MTAVESSLRTALEGHPEEWSVRMLVVEKVLERDAKDEAIELLLEAPAPPAADEVLQRVVEIAEERGHDLVHQFVLENPANAYGHQLLATILEWLGEDDKSRQHFSVANALGAMPPEMQAIANTGHSIPVAEVVEEVEEPVIEEVQPVVEEAPAPPPVAQVVPEEVPAPPPVAQVVPEDVSAPPPISHVVPEVDDRVPAPPRGFPPPVGEPALSSFSEPNAFTLEDLAPVEPPKQRGKKATAIMAAVIVHAVIFLIAALVVILPPMKDEPEIVAAILPTVQKKQEMQKKNVVKQTKKSSASAAAAAPLAQLMRANAVAKISLPNVTKTSKGPLGIGDADFGGGGFGSGGGGMGTGASFFGGSSTGRRFLFVLDHSGSMKTNQVNLRNNELEKALKSLKGVQYQVLLFAGGAYYASPGWSVKRAKGLDNIVTGPKGKYEFKSVGGYANYNFVGSSSKLPKGEWLSSTPSNVKKTMDRVKKDRLYGGTDWGLALDIAHFMDPPPDVIFFMADGTGGNAPEPILKTNSKNGRPPINMVAMQTTAGINQFAEIAKKTRGSFTIVDKKGKPIDGFDYIKKPSKYKGRL